MSWGLLRVKKLKNVFLRVFGWWSKWEWVISILQLVCENAFQNEFKKGFVFCVNVCNTLQLETLQGFHQTTLEKTSFEEITSSDASSSVLKNCSNVLTVRYSKIRLVPSRVRLALDCPTELEWAVQFRYLRSTRIEEHTKEPISLDHTCWVCCLQELLSQSTSKFVLEVLQTFKWKEWSFRLASSCSQADTSKRDLESTRRDNSPISVTCFDTFPLSFLNSG